MMSQSRSARLPVVPIADARPVGLEVVHADIIGLEHDLPARGQTRSDQVLHHLVLAVDHHVLADEIGKINAMIGASKAHDRRPDAAYPRAASARRRRSHSAIARCRIPERRRECGFRHSPRDRASSTIELDALQMQQMRQQQPCRTCADNANLRAHPSPPSASSVAAPRTACIIAGDFDWRNRRGRTPLAGSAGNRVRLPDGARRHHRPDRNAVPRRSPLTRTFAARSHCCTAVTGQRRSRQMSSAWETGNGHAGSLDCRNGPPSSAPAR